MRFTKNKTTATLKKKALLLFVFLPSWSFARQVTCEQRKDLFHAKGTEILKHRRKEDEKGFLWLIRDRFDVRNGEHQLRKIHDHVPPVKKDIDDG